MSNPLVQLKSASVCFQKRTVLEAIDMSISRSEIVTLIGPNGAGKTTLIRVVLGLLKPDSGQRTLKSGITIGYMPQKLYLEPTMPLPVRRFLALAGADRKNISEVLAKTGVSHISAPSLQTLSGGEMQRVLLARALLRKPDLLVLDEPIQGVDVNGQRKLYQLISQLRDDTGCGVLMVSHDLHLVMEATDRVICLNNHVCCSGHPQQVSRHPAYLELFGGESEALAVCNHRHNHQHISCGEFIPESSTDASTTTHTQTKTHAGFPA